MNNGRPGDIPGTNQPLMPPWAPPMPPGRCFEWEGADNGCGYGFFYLSVRGRSRRIYAHRMSYELWHGPIPPGHQIDHLCRNRRCVNPDHLEAVTPRENNLRGNSVAAHAARRTHCPAGHPLSPENVYQHDRSRKCRTCAKKRMRAYYRRRVAEGTGW